MQCGQLLFGIVAHFGYFNILDVEVGVAEQRNANSAGAQNASVVIPLECHTLDAAHVVTADVQEEVLGSVDQSNSPPKQKNKKLNIKGPIQIGIKC